MYFGFPAEPPGVTEMVARVSPQVACTTEPIRLGAGVTLVFTILEKGAQPPGGFIYRVYWALIDVVKHWLVNEGVAYPGGILGPAQLYGPSPGVAQMVAPLGPQVGIVTLCEPAG